MALKSSGWLVQSALALFPKPAQPIGGLEISLSRMRANTADEKKVQGCGRWIECEKSGPGWPQVIKAKKREEIAANKLRICRFNNNL